MQCLMHRSRLLFNVNWIESENVIAVANYRRGFIYILCQRVDIVHMYERKKRRKVKGKRNLQLPTGF